jgi:hypothetical protein
MKKKILSMDFASSPANPSSSQHLNAPATKKLKNRDASYASSPIAAAVAAAIEAAGKQPSSASLRLEVSPEAHGVLANSTKIVVCSARRVSNNDVSSTAAAAVSDDDDDGIFTVSNDSQKNNKIPPIQVIHAR